MARPDEATDWICSVCCQIVYLTDLLDGRGYACDCFEFLLEYSDPSYFPKFWLDTEPKEEKNERINLPVGR
jgi:hypothetical protein